MSYQEYFSDQAPIFGKYQRTFAIIVFMGFQFLLYFFALFSLYVILTLDFELMVALGFIVILQSFAKRSQKFINLVNDTLQLRRYASKSGIIFEEEIKQESKCIFGLHPHGVLSSCLTASMNFKSGPFSNVIGLSSRFMLACPVVGLLLRLWGVQSVDNTHMKYLMKQGKNLLLIPGGFEEATLTCRKELRIYIKNRKGFIKYAIQNNYSIYPAVYMNEHRAFWTFDYFTKFRLFLNKFKIPTVFFWNWKTLMFIPPYMEYYIVIGKKLEYEPLPIGATPSQELIDKVHAKYIEELVRTYEKYRHLNGNVPIKIF